MHSDPLTTLAEEAEAAISAADSIAALKAIRAKYLGRADGALTKVLRSLGTLPVGERKQIGPRAQALKQMLEQLGEAKEAHLLGKGDSAVDATLPPRTPETGHLHPVTQVRWLLEDLFTRMGFLIADGPEVESEWYNFDALNMPTWHPARDMQDTFYVETQNSKVSAKGGSASGGKTQNLGAASSRLVLRTQTSPVQIRAMEKYGVPLRCIVPGRVYRNEATDARHENTFWQIEGLMIDRDISLAHLISISKIFLRDLLGSDIGVRVRPGYFPFTEPSIEMDITCGICHGKGEEADAGCPVCKGTGWLEFMGAGLVHPFVLKAGGVDPKKYSGFAFGFGLTRLAMMKYEIRDIRILTSGDVRFLRQF